MGMGSYSRRLLCGLEALPFGNRTRHSHRQVDGERAPVDGVFSNGCRFPGDPDGPASEIYNCRCTLVAAVEGVDTSDAKRWSRLPAGTTYEEWKAGRAKGERRERATVSEVERAKRPPRKDRISASPKYEADMDRISSKGYRAMLKGIVGEGAADGAHSVVEGIMRHRGGTNGEDLYAIDLADGSTVTSCVTSKVASTVVAPARFRSKVAKAVAEGRRVALVHNHPASSMPSANDLTSLVEKECALGIAACHDGTIYAFRKVGEPSSCYNINQDDIDFIVGIYSSKSEKSALDAIERELGIRIEHLA